MRKFPWIFALNYLAARHRRFGSRQQLDRWQERQIQRHLRKIAARSRFYGEVAAGIPIPRWREWPRMNKARMLSRFDELVTVPVTLEQAKIAAQSAWELRDFSKPLPGGVTVGLSSGTSGNTSVFVLTEAEQAAWAGTILGRCLPRPLPALGGAHRIALFLRANSRMYEATRSRLVRFGYFDLLEPLPSALSRLRDFAPTLLVAPPSMLRILADARAHGKLRIRPERIISVAEVLDPLDEKLIQAGFGQRVHQIYQATEGFLGATCPFGTLHLNEDLLSVEKQYVDVATGRFSPIVTDFRRIAQPVIRYELDDVLIERRDRCPCGSVFLALEKVEGRADDLCILFRPDGSSGPLFPDFLRFAVAGASDGIEDFFVCNTQPGALEIALSCASVAIEARVISNIEKVCRDGGFVVPSVRFVPLPERRPGAKLRRIQRRRDEDL